MNVTERTDPAFVRLVVIMLRHEAEKMLLPGAVVPALPPSPLTLGALTSVMVKVLPRDPDETASGTAYYFRVLAALIESRFEKQPGSKALAAAVGSGLYLLHAINPVEYPITVGSVPPSTSLR